MTNKLRNFLCEQNKISLATKHGLTMHTKMQNIDISNTNDITAHISADDRLTKMFDNLSRTEVPIAGYINNKFISRRIDRLRIDNNKKEIDILDFKTDSDKVLRRTHYLKQLNEYKLLLTNIYPDYQIKCWILWTHDWTLELLN